MTNTLDSFLEKKKAESQFIGLEDGESIVIKRLKDIKMVTKAGFGGEEKDTLRLVCEVETSEGMRDKTFDNSTQRFAKEMQEKGVTIGTGFTITRNGLMTKTKYTISGVTQPTAQGTVVAQSTTPVAPTPVAPAMSLEEEASLVASAPEQSSLQGMLHPKA